MNINQINVNGPSLNDTNLGVNGTGSLQLLFAQLLLKLSGQAKEGAIARMQEIEKTQEDQKVCAHLLAEARKLKEEAKQGNSDLLIQLSHFSEMAARLGNPLFNYQPMPEELKNFLDKYGIPYPKDQLDDDGRTVILRPNQWQELADKLIDIRNTIDHRAFMPDEMYEYMQKNNIPLPTAGDTEKDRWLDKDQWDAVIQNLQTHLDQIGANTQQQMVYIQDLMGQYNSYLQGANTQIATSNQTTTAVAKGQ